MKKLALAFLVLITGTSSLSFSAHADTDAWWAWPGMEFDVYKQGWYECSVGFPAWDEDGNAYFITAGHCFRDDNGTHYVDNDGSGVSIYSPDDHDTPIGYELSHTIPQEGIYDDISLVKMFSGRKLTGYGWEHIPNKPLEGQTDDPACLVGERHNTSNCGIIRKTYIHSTMRGYPWDEIVDSASYCGHPGDSGGAVYNSEGALGINISGASNRNEPGTPGECDSQFVPIKRVLSILHQTHPTLTIY